MTRARPPHRHARGRVVKDRELHVVPVGESRRHDINDSCWCNPIGMIASNPEHVIDEAEPEHAVLFVHNRRAES